MSVRSDGGARRADGRGDVALDFLEHRIQALGGEVTMTYPANAGMSLKVSVPLADALAE